MGVVIINGPLTKKQIQIAREEYDSYIKITADIEQQIVLIGGEYHADAEAVLVREHKSKNSNIWGGGYDLEKKIFETNALINVKPILLSNNPNIEILHIKQKFLELVTTTLVDIESFI